MDNHGWIHPGITDTGGGGPEMGAGKALESSHMHSNRRQELLLHLHAGQLAIKGCSLAAYFNTLS